MSKNKHTLIYKKQKGWAYRVYYMGEDGKNHSINKQGFKSKSDAEDAAREIENRRAVARLDIAENITFAQYFESWINTYKLGRYSLSTDSKYEVALRFIQDYFYDDLLKDITKMEYQGFIDDYSKDHVKDSIYRINGYIGSCIQEAVDERIIDRNFTRNVVITTKKKGKSADLKYLESDVASSLRIMAKENATLSNISACEILFALGTGCRYAEIVGLTWDNVDFENHTVNIQKTYDYKKRTGFLPTKTESSVRQITISDELIRELRLLRMQQRETFFKQGFKNNKNFVFINKRHTVPSDTSANNVLRKYLKKIYFEKNKSKGMNDTENRKTLDNMELIGFHGLRHTHASYLIAHGLSLEYISQRLGHSNVAITSKVYIHLLNDYREREDSKAMKALSKL
ncbi:MULTISPECIES: tyrosine-type recombinase/integrase [Companilactobacillus]|nr:MULTISPECIES: tyrosine-type recombinase/integrase [Companilactobacillus]GEO58518.1 integrase [Companilactobacillus paralimentarius]KAE9557539.1 hypothetical protein ATN92_15400 [Companilactobacillus bobalius]KAE9563685.1 hypothetical protein ATN92_02850 [Companilactobacillus bobalius]OVE96507.1 Tyrosine recombinase XerC-like [Companilactobacillus bobalius]PMD70290.1 site-specific integrase [Companilactobacillus nuruki]